MTHTVGLGDGCPWRLVFDAARQAFGDGGYAVAEDRCRRALVAAPLGGLPAADHADVLDLLVYTLMCQDHLQEVVDLGREWRTMVARAHGHRSPEHIESLLTLADAVRRNGDPERARRLLGQVRHLLDPID